MKKKHILFSFLVILCTICIFIAFYIECGGKDDGGKNINGEDDKTMEFNYENSFQVIKESLGCDDTSVEFILEIFEMFGVKGATSAEIEEEEGIDTLILEIQSEDSKTFRLYMESNYRLYAIKDMETGKYVYAVVE